MNLLNTIKPQTREETIIVKAEVDKIVRGVNKKVKESMERTKKFIRRSLVEAK